MYLKPYKLTLSPGNCILIGISYIYAICISSLPALSASVFLHHLKPSLWVLGWLLRWETLWWCIWNTRTTPIPPLILACIGDLMLYFILRVGQRQIPTTWGGGGGGGGGGVHCIDKHDKQWGTLVEKVYSSLGQLRNDCNQTYVESDIAEVKTNKNLKARCEEAESNCCWPG